MKIFFEYKGMHGSVEVDDYAIVSLIEKIFLKPCTYCNGTGTQPATAYNDGIASCMICYGRKQISRFD